MSTEKTTKSALFSQLRRLTESWTIHDAAYSDPVVNRCRIIGQELNDLGGAVLMREAYYDAKAANPAVTVVQAYWDGIGDWRW